MPELEEEGTEVAAATPTTEPTPTAEPTLEPTATPDPARLPDTLIQGAAAAGLTIEFAQDITPEMMRQISSFGPPGQPVPSVRSPPTICGSSRPKPSLSYPPISWLLWMLTSSLS
ncbi:MAG: hypothetical protein IPL78_33380 [Chloroflexi bacterium]|nr:hypothetical protein [Chloroflexota bacterium]